MVFRYPLDPHYNLIKRCVALPGDTVQIKKGIVYINGDLQPFPALAQVDYAVWYNKPDAFQSLLNNRHNSVDSREWGLVPEELIIGKAVVVLWSGRLKSLRLKRVMKKIE